MRAGYLLRVTLDGRAVSQYWSRRSIHPQLTGRGASVGNVIKKRRKKMRKHKKKKLLKRARHKRKR